jgi:hypothetical protein
MRNKACNEQKKPDLVQGRHALPVHVAFTTLTVAAREWRVTCSCFPMTEFYIVAYRCRDTLLDSKHKYSSPSRFRLGIHFNKIDWELVSVMPLSKLKSSLAKRVSSLT